MQEKELSSKLTASGISSFYVEITSDVRRLHVFLDSPEMPEPLKGLAHESVEEVGDTFWNEAWAASYTGHELTPGIYVRASGTDLPGKKFRHIINISPGRSFGDGNHPTTRLCAQLMEEYLAGADNPAELTMLDMGTGSGILAITGYLLGVRDIELFDVDEESIVMAEKNLLLNGIEGITPAQADLYTWGSKRSYDLITANLLTGIIEDNINRIKRAPGPDGVIILSGISKKWTRSMMRLFKKHKLFPVHHKKLEGWNGFLLKNIQ